MKKALFILFVFASTFNCNAEEMSLSSLKLILAQKAAIVKDQGHFVQYNYAGLELYLIADESANRMRMMSGITEVKNIKEGELMTMMKANFDKALDAKYAISDGILWSVFVHPLKELQKQQVVDALTQVVNLVRTYGSTYSSTGLVFGGEEKN